mmetsp:Transcript_52288/g.113960  ORF Transcript_52288/g.113960 Transcript_52288/m.113960 type:complete len:155 (+) Transcript_52288:335-799(+)
MPSLHVCVIGADGLPDTDWFTEPDAFARVTLLGEDGDLRTCESSKVSNSRSPQWNYCCLLSLDERASKLTIDVVDKDIFDDDFIGSCELLPVAHELQRCELKNGDNLNGHVEFQIDDHTPSPPPPPLLPCSALLPSCLARQSLSAAETPLRAAH